MQINKDDYIADVTGRDITIRTKELNGKYSEICKIRYSYLAVTADVKDVEKLVEYALKCIGKGARQ